MFPFPTPSQAPQWRRLFLGGVVALGVFLMGTADAAAGPADWLRYLWNMVSPTPPPPPPPPPRAPMPDIFAALPEIGFAPDSRVVSVRADAGTVKLRIIRSEIDESLRSTVRATAFPLEVGVAGRDFQPFDSLIEFGPGEKEKTVSIFILNAGEPGRRAVLEARLSSPDEAALTVGAEAARIEIQPIAAPPPPPPPARLRVGVPSFGIVLENGTVSREAIVVNEGGQASRLFAARVTGPGFSVKEDGCREKVLGPGESCRVVISFTPVYGTTAAAGEVLVDSDAPGGIASASLKAAISALPPPLDPMGPWIDAAKRARREGQGLAETLIPAPPSPPKQAEYRMEDKDYRGINIGKNLFTYPVDRSRILTPDMKIPCVLEVTINSQIPGYVTCVVEYNVYGGPRTDLNSQRLILISAGTRVLGDYQSLQKQGDTRLNVIWRRFIRPDGSSVFLPRGFQALDAMGRTGLPGSVDSKWLERYAGPLLITALTAATAYAATPAATTTTSTTTPAGLQAAQSMMAEGLGRVAAQMLEENIDLRPVITVPAGARLVIQPLVDLWFAAPERLEPVGPSPKNQPVN